MHILDIINGLFIALFCGRVFVVFVVFVKYGNADLRKICKIWVIYWWRINTNDNNNTHTNTTTTINITNTDICWTLWCN